MQVRSGEVWTRMCVEGTCMGGRVEAVYLHVGVHGGRGREIVCGRVEVMCMCGRVEDVSCM